MKNYFKIFVIVSIVVWNLISNCYAFNEEDYITIYQQELSKEEQKKLNEEKQIIDVQTLNYATNNTVGEDVDLSNLKIILTYEDYSKEIVNSNDERIRFGEIDNSLVGIQNMAIYMNRSGREEFLFNYMLKFCEEGKEPKKRSTKNRSSEIINFDDIDTVFIYNYVCEYYLDEEPVVTGIQIIIKYIDGSYDTIVTTENDIESVDYTKELGESPIAITLVNGLEVDYDIAWYNRDKTLSRENPIANKSKIEINNINYNSDEIDMIYSYKKEDLPRKYNLTDLFDIRVTHQLNLGLCKLFAFTKSVETNLRMTKGLDYDLSERYSDYMMSKELYGYREARFIRRRN